jgi:hypothetical protein
MSTFSLPVLRSNYISDQPIRVRAYVGFWPKADISAARADVRF